MGNSLSSMIDGFLLLLMVYVFIVPLVTWVYWNYSMGEDLEFWIAREQAREMGILVREAEHRIDIRLFFDEYPRWEFGTPHWSVILHEMFLHTAERGQKEAEYMICQGCQGSTSEPDLEAGHSAMELVGYWTSNKEIWDIYHNFYLLRRSPGLPSCGDQLRRRTICDILSSLTGWLHWHGYHATTGEDLESEEEWLPRPNGRESYEEAFRAACQRALDTAKVLQGEIERLSWRMRDTSWTYSRSNTRSRGWSWSRSHSRAHRVALRLGDQGPLADLCLGGGCPLENQRWSWTPKEVWGTTHQNPLFQMWRHG